MKYLLFIFVGLGSLGVNAQTGVVTGIVRSNETPLSNAAVFIKEKGTNTDSTGRFTIKDVEARDKVLIVRLAGYSQASVPVKVIAGDTTSVEVILAKQLVSLKTVEVQGDRSERIVRDSTVQIEVYTSAFIKRNASENLLQIVNSINGVQEQLNCGICNTGDIHINGLEGPYTLVMIDGMPVVSALSTVYGLNGIPASIIDRIEVTKGPSASFYGSEAIAGTINVITKNPSSAPSFEVGTFMSSQFEKNIDIAGTVKREKLSVLGSAAWFGFDQNIDRNLDGFTDIARANRGTLFLKSEYKINPSLALSSGVRVYNEERFGGQLDWNRNYKGSDLVYGEWINTQRGEFLSSLKHAGTFGKWQADVSAVYHFQDSYYGTNAFLAKQTTFFSSFRFEKPFRKHTLTGGLSQRTNLYDDNSPVKGGENSFLPGIFIEDELRSKSGNLRLMPGTRLDYFNGHGAIVSPRLNLLWKTGQFSRIQMGGGKGFRIVSVFTEDHSALTGSRTVVIGEKLKPETSWSGSLTYNQALSLAGATNLEVSGFYTYFSNQIIPDYSTPNVILYENLSGYSVSRGAAVNLSQSFTFPLKASAGITFIDAFEIEQGPDGDSRSEILYAPDYSGVFQVSYTLKKIRTEIAWSGKVYGPMQLPEFPEPFVRPSQSPVFSVQNIQFTHRHKALEFSLAVKNLFDFVQDSPLISPSQPFSDSFDTSYIYGPLQGRRVVLSVRFTRF